MSIMMTGTVMRFDADKGFGFIKPDDGGKDLFVHVTELRQLDSHGIIPGVTRVSFALADSSRGPKAVNVQSELAAAAPLDYGYEFASTVDARLGEPAPATVESWRALWRRASDRAFDSLLDEARRNGWVQE